MKRFIHRYLDPADRMSELLFGLIMTLTFTLGASLVIEEGPDATRALLLGVLGCNLAWGLIDGLLYIFGAMFERGATNRAAHLYHQQGREVLAEKINEYVTTTYGNAVTETTRSALQRDIVEHVARTRPPPVGIIRDDIYGAIASFLLVVSTSAPALIPFMVLDDRLTALRTSNFLMIGLIYLIGYQWAATIDANRHRVGFTMAFGSLVIVQLTILLGG